MISLRYISPIDLYKYRYPTVSILSTKISVDVLKYIIEGKILYFSTPLFLVLGYKRNIPDWPRYSLQGDSGQGVHDLLIQNVSREDAGVYECQVSPVAGQNPLRRQTLLVILVKPTLPKIVTLPGVPQPSANGQLVVAFDSNETQSMNSSPLKLICQAKGGYPTPKFEWFHNGNLISVSEDLDESQDNDDAMNSQEITKDEFELEIDKRKLSTRDRLVCLVSNKATKRSHHLYEQKLRAEVMIVIHSLPGDPEIIDWDKFMNGSKSLSVGSTFEATCRVTPPGNPPGQVLWRFENPYSTMKLDQLTIFENDATKSFIKNVISISNENIVNQVTDEKILSRIKIANLNSTIHGLDLVCAVRHQIGPEKTTRKKIFIQQQIDNQSEMITENKQNLYVYLDRPQYLLCVTGEYYGQVEVKWRGKLPNSENWEVIAPSESFLRNEPQELHPLNLIQASIIQLVSTNVKPNALLWTEIECSAVSSYSKEIYDQMTSNKVILEMYEIPGVPTITGHKEGTLLPEGSTLTLHCTAKQGNPPGKLVWTHVLKGKNVSELIDESNIIEQNQSNVYPDGMIYSMLNINVTKLHDGASFRCGAVNPGYGFSDAQFSSPVEIGVAYSATVLNISIIGGTGQLTPRSKLGEELQTVLNYYKTKYNVRHIPTVQAKAGDTLKLMCQVEMSNPKPKLEWQIHHCPPIQFASIFKGINNSVNEMKSLNDPYESFFKNCQTIHLTEYVNSSIHLQSNEKYALTKSSYQNTHLQTLTILNSQILLSIQFSPVFLTLTKQLNWPIDMNSFNDNEQFLPHYIVIEGGSLDLDLEPISNPSLSKTSWFRNGIPLPLSRDLPKSYSSFQNEVNESFKSYSTEDSNQRLVLNPTKIFIHPVKRSDMANYTLVATNALGSKEFTFFLNVTYGPQLIGSPTINVTVSGKKAELFCQSEANPTPTVNAVRWRRLTNTLIGHDSLENIYRNSVSRTDLSTKNHPSQADSAAGIHCGKGEKQFGYKYYAKCWCSSPGVMTSTLTIYDLSPSDVGRYQCNMDNGIGSPAVRTIDLTYPFEPRIVPVTRWSRAAPNMASNKNKTTSSTQPTLISDQLVSIIKGPHARLTCVIAAEPMPEVQWLREPANLTLIEGGQFHSIVRPIRPGLYHAILYLINPQDVDLGRYFCKAKNLVGEDIGRVDLIHSTQPDVPSSPRLLNATSTSLTVSWTQGFNGGPEQTFMLHWHPNEDPDHHDKANIKEDLFNEVLTYSIIGKFEESLQKATTYRVSVSAYNALTSATSFTPYLLASTTAFDSLSEEEAMRDEAKTKSLQDVQGGHWDSRWQLNSKDSGSSINLDPQRRSVRSGHELNSSDDNAFVIITAVSVFGSFILIANLLIILIFTRHKRQRIKQDVRKTSATGELMQIYPVENGYPEIHANPQTSFPMYPDDMRLNSSYMLQSPPHDQFSPFQNGWEQIPLNVCPDQASSFIRGNQIFSSSPHSSLNAMNVQNFNSPNHIEFNNRPPSDISVQPSSVLINSPDPTNVAYLIPDTRTAEPIQNMQDFNDYPEFVHPAFQNSCSPLSYKMEQNQRHVDRPTATQRRLVTVGRTLTDKSSRTRSPHSEAASSVSTIRSNGHGNTSSLERSLSTFQRSPHSNNFSDYRHLGGGLTLPNGGLGPNIISQNLHQNPHLFISNTRTFQNSAANMIQSGMTTSFHGGHTPSWKHCPNPQYSDDYTTSGQQVARNVYDSFSQQQSISQHMNSFELSDSQIFNNRQQMQSNKSSEFSAPRYYQESPARYLAQLENNWLQSNQNSIDFPSNGSTIPPPNDFQTTGSHIPYIQVNSSTPTVSRSYYHITDESENIVIHDNSGADHLQVINQQHLGLPINVSNEMIIRQNQGNYPSYGCVL
ncbi:Nephrin [Schistosoma japonicum]|nr:Nephrin [Schistosoma japonicum]